MSDEYEVAGTETRFRFLDALVNSDMHFETAGRLWGGRRVWVLARLPEYVELRGDLSATYVYVANSHTQRAPNDDLTGLRCVSQARAR